VSRLIDPVLKRTTKYRNGAEWRRDARYGAPDYSISATTVAAVLGQGTSNLAGPWAAWSRARSWDGDAEAEQWAAEEAAGTLDDGLTWEPYLLGWAAKEWDFDIEEVAGSAPFRVHHPEHPWARVSPDGLWSRDGILAIPDSKCVFGYSNWPDDGTVIDRASKRALSMFPADRGAKYLMQAYWSLLCMPEADAFDFVVGLHFRDVRRIRVMRDDRYQETLLRRVASWRDRHLVKGNEPDWDESKECVRHVERGRFERDDRREATAEEVDLIRSYRDAKLDEKAALAEQARIRVELANRMGEFKTLTINLGEGKPASYTVGKRSTTTSRLELL